jgi:hypothetical protein
MRLISERGSLLTTIRLTAAFFSPDDAMVSPLMRHVTIALPDERSAALANPGQ